MSLNKIPLKDDSLDQVSGGSSVPYIPQSGDSWATLEAKYHVSAEVLRKWNDLPENAPLPLGKTLHIYY